MRLLRFKLVLILLPFFLLSLPSCRQESSPETYVDEADLLTISEINGDYKPSLYGVNLINQNAERQAIVDAKINDDKSLSFALDDQYFRTIQDKSLFSTADEIIAMGDQIRPYPNDIFAMLKVEIAPKKLTGIAGTIYYSQFPIFYKYTQFLAAQRTSLLKNVNLSKVGYQKVIIKDFVTGKPVPHAQIIAAMNGTTIDDNNLGQQVQMKSWESNLLRPIRTYTNVNGEAYIYPLTVVGNTRFFSFIAYADKYCIYMSPPVEWTPNAKTANTYTIKPCATTSKTAIGLVATPATKEKLFLIPIDSGATASVIHTNGRTVTFRVDSISPVIRNMQIKFIEGLGPNGQANPEQPVINLQDRSRYPFKFQSEFTITIPASFVSTGTENGSFTIEVSSSNSESEVFSTSYLYGKRFSQILSPSWADLKIYGPLLVQNVINGDPKTTFTLHHNSLCKDGAALGVQVGTGPKVYADCKESQAQFTVDDLKIDPLNTKTGGFVSMRVYLRDIFGNLSQDDDSGDASNNAKQVFVDYGIPDLVTSLLTLQQTELGFAHFNDAQGTNASPFNFIPYITPTPLTPSTIGGFVFRFGSPDLCKTHSDLSQRDGVSTNDQKIGLTVQKFRIGSSPTTISSKNYIDCVENPAANPTKAANLIIDPADIEFPSFNAGNANFYLQVKDSAGNESLPYNFTIPHCPASTLCWDQ